MAAATVRNVSEKLGYLMKEYVKQIRWFIEKTWFGYALILPAALLVGLIILVPILYAFWISFHNMSYLQPGEAIWVGLQNYRQLLSDPMFWHSLKNTVIYVGTAVTSMYLLGLVLALGLKKQLPKMGIFRSTSLVPWVIPPVVNVIVWDWMLQSDFGLVNQILELFGLPTATWFGSLTFAFPLVIMLRVWKDTPFVAIALMASMRSIPDQMYEAAEVDGAGAWQKFRHITLPNISYMSMIMIVLETAACANTFQLIYLSTGGGPINRTEVLSTYIYSQAFQKYALGYAAALGVVMLLLLAIFAAIYLRLEETE
ncbi:MAG: carbohydrate ABC transporter permease [Halobacteriaceae archaeon]